ncbi:MAG: 50S ribosomal protein L20 [Bacteroidota bacterium]|jgi:large subunit ribosomal protein L20|nr:50S ribosomal protein L20 [Bacteroidota bacterium]
MPRSKNKVAAHRRRKKTLARAKGFYGASSKLLTVAKHRVDKSLQFAFRDRRAKKRTMRQLWITRINAASRALGVSYSRLIDGLNKNNIDINRKMLAEIAATDSTAFAEIVKLATR